MLPDNNYLESIYEVIREFNGQLPPDSRLACSPDAVLIGDGGVLDSLGLINFMVLLEDSLASRLGERVVLLDERYMTAGEGPFRTVRTLAQHISSLIEA